MKILMVLAGLSLATAVAGCASGTTGVVVPTAERPGTSIKVSNPNVGKWTVFQPTQRRSNARFYACKPMACAADAMVAINTAPSPTRNPDRIALEKAAKLLPAQARAQDIMMEAASEGDERQVSLSSKVTEMRGYPAIIAEVKRTTRGKVRYIMRGDLFVGNILIKVVSISSTREEAKRNFDEFVVAMEIVDVAPSASPAGTMTSEVPVASSDTIDGQTAISNGLRE